jgi:ferredoxin
MAPLTTKSDEKLRFFVILDSSNSLLLCYSYLIQHKARCFCATLRRMTMAYKITDKCVSCGTCAGECPVEAISAGDPIYTIDPAKCVGCGTCAGACPMEAIVEE